MITLYLKMHDLKKWDSDDDDGNGSDHVDDDKK